MPLDASIPLQGRTPKFSLVDMGALYAQDQVLQRGQQQVQTGALGLEALQRQSAQEQQVQAAYAQQYGGGLAAAAPGMPAPPQTGLAGAAPAQPTPTGAPQGLAGLGPEMGMQGQGQRQEPGQSQAFVNQLYAISPKAGREAEQQQLARQKLQFEQHLQQTAYVGQVARGVLQADTQAAYELGVQQLQAAGVPTQHLPSVYDRQLVQQYEAMADDGVSQLKRATAQLQLTRAQHDLGQVPDYGLGQDGNAAMYARYGAQIPPGGRPTQAMVDTVLTEVQGRKEGVQAAQGREAAEIARTQKPLEGDAQKVVSDLTALRDLTDDIMALRTDAYTGPVVGRTGYLREQTNRMEDQEVAFRRTVKDVQDILARLRSGAALPLGELANLEKLAPSVSDPPRVFQSKMQSFQRALETTRAARLRVATTGREQLRQETRPTTPLVGQSPHSAIAVDQLTPAQIADEEAWFRQQLGGR